MAHSAKNDNVPGRDLQYIRARAALSSLFVGDSLAMPVHWYYNPEDIQQAFPEGLWKLEAAPESHPGSIMSLHSTRRGGRSSSPQLNAQASEIVGKVILKGRRHLWGQPNRHYHHGMKAGDNTLNAHYARVLIRTLIAASGCYNPDTFLEDYIAFMTADPPLHNDTYAESFHRGFFANLTAGKPPLQCAALTHDTPSIGGLVAIGPLALHQSLAGQDSPGLAATCRTHLLLTHPDRRLSQIAEGYAALIDGLLHRPPQADPRALLVTAARETLDLDLESLARRARFDEEVVGGRYSTACYITDSWPGVLYLAYKYCEDPKAALLANANLGGDNVHRGAVLGLLVSLACGRTLEEWFAQLLDRQAISAEIDALLATTEGNRARE